MAPPRSAQPQPAPNSNATHAPDPCSTTTDRNAPAGSKTSLGAKSDCNGRPTSDDSVVEAMDEQGPILTPPTVKSNNVRH